MTLPRRMSLGLVACLLMAMPMHAAEPKAYRLDLRKPAAFRHGRIAIARGTSSPGGHRFMLDNLTILQPVAIAVATLGNDDTVELVLGRDTWNERIRGAVTEHGAAVFKLRTEGNIRILVGAKADPKPYVLMAWVGDEVKLPRRPLLKGRDANAFSRRRWIAIGSAIVVLIGLAMLGFLGRGRRRTAGAAMIALAIGASAAVSAQRAGTPFPEPPPPAMSTMEQIRNPGSPWSERMEQIDREFGRLGRASRPFDFLSNAVSQGYNAYDAWQASQDFTQDDANYRPNLDPDGMPDLPVGCAMSPHGDACTDCYDRAQTHVIGMMELLERLRGKYDSTKRYTDAMVSFGDNASGIRGVTGPAWQTERRGIMREFARFEQTYEEKRQGMMGSLRRALDEIAVCEITYVQNPDWYSRHGFVYYQFMEARYKH